MNIVILTPGDLLVAALLIGAAIVVALYRRDQGVHPDCVTCGEFAMYTIKGQPLCEDHARIAVRAGYQAEPIR